MTAPGFWSSVYKRLVELRRSRPELDAVSAFELARQELEPDALPLPVESSNQRFWLEVAGPLPLPSWSERYRAIIGRIKK